MLHNEIAQRYSFYIGNFISNTYFSCYINEKSDVECSSYIYLINRGKEKEIQYFYYYDPKNEKNIQSNVSIVVTAPKTLKINYYYIYNNNYYSTYYFIKDVKAKIEFNTNLNTLFNKTRDKIKIGNNELLQCNRSSSDSYHIYCYGLFNESTLKEDGTYERLNITLNGENTGLTTYVMTDNKNIKIKRIKLKYNDYYISEEEKNFILNIDSNFLTEKNQISLRKNRYENNIVLSCNKTDNINEIHCLAIISESGEYYVYINGVFEDNCNSIYFNDLSTIQPKNFIANKTTECIIYVAVNDLDLNKFVLRSNELGKLDGIVEKCNKIDSYQIKCYITIPNIGVYSLKNENYSVYYTFAEVYSFNEHMSEFYDIFPNIFYINKESEQYYKIKVDANYDLDTHIIKLVPSNSSLESFIIFCSFYNYLYINCSTYFDEIGEYTLYFDDVKKNINFYVINDDTKIISNISEITPIEINYTSSIVRFELISDTNFGIKYLNLSLSLNENISYYLQCEPSSDSSIKSICSTQFKSFGKFTLQTNKENLNYYPYIYYSNEVNVYGPQILKINPLNFKYDSNNYQKFEITFSSDYGEYFNIILKGIYYYHELTPNCSKINLTNIECDVIFDYENIYKIEINGLKTNFEINVGIEDNNNNFYYKVSIKILFFVYFLFFS